MSSRGELRSRWVAIVVLAVITAAVVGVSCDRQTVSDGDETRVPETPARVNDALDEAASTTEEIERLFEAAHERAVPQDDPPQPWVDMEAMATLSALTNALPFERIAALRLDDYPTVQAAVIRLAAALDALFMRIPELVEHSEEAFSQLVSRDNEFRYGAVLYRTPDGRILGQAVHVPTAWGRPTRLPIGFDPETRWVEPTYVTSEEVLEVTSETYPVIPLYGTPLSEIAPTAFARYLRRLEEGQALLERVVVQLRDARRAVEAMSASSAS